MTKGGTCGECGRPFSNWSDPNSTLRNSAGNKDRQHQNKKDNRESVYRDWRRTWDLKYVVNDVPDQVEWDHDMNPVGLLELSACARGEGYDEMPPGYMRAVWTRFTVRDPKQHQSLVTMSKMTGTPSFFVLFEENLDEFWVRGVMPEWETWTKMDARTYKKWIASLRRDPRKEILSFIKGWKNDGATTDQIIGHLDFLGLYLPPDQFASHMLKLKKKGRIVDTGNERALNGGPPTAVWVTKTHAR